MRRTRSSPAPSPIATGRTSSAAASSIRLDDMRVTNPPSQPRTARRAGQGPGRQQVQPEAPVKTIVQEPDVPAQLDAERVQQARQADLRPLLSAAHERRSAVRRGQPGDRQPGAVRRPAERQHAPKRAIMLPDESFPSYFLDVFGRPQRISACECERVSEANLAQALHLLNSDEVQGKLSRPGGRAEVDGQGPAAGRREGRGAVPVGASPASRRRNSATWRWTTSTRTQRTRRWPTRTSSGRC